MSDNVKLIDPKPIKKFIVDGLNNPDPKKAFGYDAISILAEIEFAPIVDPVKHGRWVSCGCGFDCCSECRKVYTDGYFTAMGIKPRIQFNYCPNCGAKMDLKGE